MANSSFAAHRFDKLLDHSTAADGKAFVNGRCSGMIFVLLASCLDNAMHVLHCMCMNFIDIQHAPRSLVLRADVYLLTNGTYHLLFINY